MEPSSAPFSWPAYWALRQRIERDAVVALDARPELASRLMDLLELHCFGCGAPVTAAEEELCLGCRERRPWALN